MRGRILEYVPGLLAGLAGGVGGYFAVAFLIGWKGLWAPILIGAFAGLACGQASPVASRARGVVLAVLTLGLVVFAEWKLFIPNFEYDGTLTDFARHVPQLSGMHQALMAVNVVIAYWWGRERGIGFDRFARPGQPPVAGADFN